MDEKERDYNYDEGHNEKRSFSSILEDFASSTSAHGISKISAAKSYWARVLWIISVCVVYCVMFWMCAQLLVRFLDKPVTSRIEVSQEESLAYPAVTICNHSPLKEELARARAKELYDILLHYSNETDTSTDEDNTDSITRRDAENKKPNRKKKKKKNPKQTRTGPKPAGKQKHNEKTALNPTKVPNVKLGLATKPTNSTTKPGKKAKPKTKPGKAAKPKTKPGKAAKPKTKPGKKAKPKTKPGKAGKPKTKPGKKKKKKPWRKGKRGKPGNKRNKKKAWQRHKKRFKARRKGSIKRQKQTKLLQHAEVDRSSWFAKMADKLISETPSATLQSLGYTLDEMLVDCKWSGYKCNTGSLRSLWTHFWHWKYGNCYTFNSGLSENGTRQPILTVDKAGPYSGLDMLLDIHQGQYLPFTEDAGVRVVLTDQRKMPFPFDDGFSIAPGFSTSVGVRRVSTRRVDPYGNNSCVPTDDEHFSAEDIYKKMFHVDYSVLTCRNSCLATKQTKNCNCTETRFPMKNASSCDSDWQQDCLNNVLESYDEKSRECAQKCPQPCLNNHFRYTISNSKWSLKYLERLLHKYQNRFKGNDTFRLGENFVRLKIFYQELSQEKIIYEEAYSLTSLFADFGGQLGLWIGISVLTVGEIIELLYTVAIFAFKKKKKPTDNYEINCDIETKA